MRRVAICFLTKDRCELTRLSIKPLMQPDLFDLLWIDGSATEEGRRLWQHVGRSPHDAVYTGVVGGADAAVAFALTKALAIEPHYSHIGLCENDVLLHPDFFGPMMALFDRGENDGLEVGAVSARCYEDRILFQRDGYAVVHNIGWGQQVMTREAAQIALHNMRSCMTGENRAIFVKLTGGLDIAKWWAFKEAGHWLVPDWNNDRLLAAHGLASLALTPSPVEMIGQIPSLKDQGLKLATEPVELLRNDKAFEDFAARTWSVRNGLTSIEPAQHWLVPQSVGNLIFTHYVPKIGGTYNDGWKLRWHAGFGPFAYEANRKGASLSVPLFGQSSIVVSGGGRGGDFRIGYGGNSDVYTVAPESAQPNPTYINLNFNNMKYQDITVTAEHRGLVLYGIYVTEPQVVLDRVTFDHSVLPPVE